MKRVEGGRLRIGNTILTYFLYWNPFLKVNPHKTNNEAIIDQSK